MNRWLSILKTIGPMVLVAVPGVPAALVPVILKGIEQAEKIPGAKGKDKLDHVAGLAKTAQEAVNVVREGPAPTPEATEAAVKAGISAVVQAVNVVKSFQSPELEPVDPSTNVGGNDLER